MATAETRVIRETIEYIYDILSTDADTSIRAINENTTSPSDVAVEFHRYGLLNEFITQDYKYSPPAVGITYKGKIDIEEERDSIEETWDMLILIDVCFANIDPIQAKLQCLDFTEDIKATLKKKRRLEHLLLEPVSIIEIGGQRIGEITEYFHCLVYEVSYIN